MARTLNLVAVSGSLQRPSRTLALVEHLVERIGDAVPIRARTIELGTVGPRLAGALYRNQLPPEVEADIAAVEQADVLVVGSPVYRATYSGLFKHFFDFVHHEALVDVPVLLAATGGSERHALVIDHQLRPLFSFFQARTLPLGVYGTDKDFTDYRITDAALLDRAALAVERALPLLRAGREGSAPARPALAAVA
ncbi:FMN reductase [Acidovorax sp. NCPPB 3859]|nr:MULTISPECIES: FMN reductase [unclassified Acidovorax]MDA8450921.1 FMN reductase [Acidovorax sp. GBBC 3297]MDA8460264.1 FMN reductase [Acidovorax sp. GBBC 3333]MDA8465300.1 FMN reductase [Acidovorax sp. GBBC 3332]MDA8470334.1 FMN reductase [Acidovorax sp. GBBC 3299]WCM79505.1 FMN reductase [Acidovorax sp. GBBC 712]